MNITRTTTKSMSPADLDAAMKVRFYNAVDAAAHMRLPVYLLSEPKSRRRHEIPHYQFNRFIRYRLDELQAWMQQRSRKDGMEAARAA